MPSAGGPDWGALDKPWTTWRSLLYVILSGAAAIFLVWAEEHKSWYVAQAAALLLVALLLLALWDRYRATPTTVPISAEVRAYNRAITRLLGLVSIGYFGMVLNATRHDRWECGTVARSLGYGTVVAGACFIGGGLLGILFGFRPTGPSQKTAGAAGTPDHPHTNLEEIADWLTKIILGAGLVELTNFVRNIPRIGKFVATAVEPLPLEPSTKPAINPAVPLPPCSYSAKDAVHVGTPMAIAIMAFFLAGGLLYGYLWSRWEFALTAVTPHQPEAAQGDQAEQKPPAV